MKITFQVDDGFYIIVCSAWQIEKLQDGKNF